MHWRDLEPAREKTDFSMIDDALQRLGRRSKTLQLIVVPGFFSPQWLLDDLAACDFTPRANAGPGAHCGKALFEVPYGHHNGEARYLPLPWDPAYKTEWKWFLSRLAERYNDDPRVVSIAIAGPTSVSVEMSLPNETPDELEMWRRLLSVFYPQAQYRDSNRAVIEEWEKTVDLYGQLFRNKTIVMTRGSGMLRFHKGDPQAAKDEIIEYFVRASLGNNAKATQTSGMKASRDFEGGIEGVKDLCASTATLPLSQRILGGAQFNSSVTRKPESMGGKGEETLQEPVGLTPAKAMRNVLAVYFKNTPSGDAYGATRGKAPIHYLQIYAPDILYANSHADVQALLLDAGKRIQQIAADSLR